MKKHIPWKDILTTSLPILAVAAIIVLLGILSGGSELTLSDNETITPIVFTPSQDLPQERVLAAENDSFALWADMSAGQIFLHDKGDDTWFCSSPQGLEETELKNNVKFQLGALLAFEYSDRDSNAHNSQNSFAGSVNKGNYSANLIDDGVRFDFWFEDEGFLIPLELRLTEKGLNASVPLADIQEESDRVFLTSVSILPNFGAAQPEDDGYLLLPDGSGSLADFSLRSFTYSQRIYGEDNAVIQNTVTNVSQTARLPVFGVKRNESAFLSVISSGAARAIVDAAAPTEKKPFATVSARFLYREIMTVDVSQKTFESTQVNVFENEPCGIPCFSVDYLICEEPDYISMADSYRDYLAEQGAQSVEGVREALYIGLVGGVESQQSVLGIPVKKVLPVTTFSDAENIVNELIDAGVPGMTVSYDAWYSGGAQSRLTTDLQAEGELGGDKALKSFANLCRENNTALYLDLNMTDMRKDQFGFWRKYSAAQSVRREPVIAYDYYPSTFQKKSDAQPCYLLSPAKIGDAVGKAQENLDKFPVAGYSASGLSSKIYSDMGARGIDRAESEQIWTEALQTLASEITMLLPQANAYAIAYADTITDVPLCSSGYLLETSEVPFYAMVMHGLKYLSSEDINSYANPDQAVLRALEAGVGLKYTFGAQNVAKLADTPLEAYGYISAERWLPHAEQNYLQTREFLMAVSDKRMVNHILISDEVRYSEFENGMGVYVNYSNEDVVYNGVVIPANGFTAVGW